VGEERKSFSGEIFISSSSSEWLALTLEFLVDFPEDQDFIKSFREGSRVLIARRGCNQAGRFLEAASFRMGGWKGFIVIPEGRGGWGWIKFSNGLRKSAVCISTSVGWGSGFLHELVENKGKKVEAWPGLVSFPKGPSFVEVLKAGSAAVVKKAPMVGGRLSGRMVTPVDQCELDLLPAVRVIDADLRLVLDCSILESSSFDLLGKDHPHRLMGKTFLPHASLKFEISMLRTWSKWVIGFNLALGRAAKKLLGRLARNGLRRKGLCLGRFLRKPNSFRSSSFSTEMTPVASFGPCDLNLLEFPIGDPLCEVRSGAGSSLVKSVPPFVFPPLPNAELPSPATLAAPPALTGLLCDAELSVSSVPSLSRAFELGKKIRSSPFPLLQSRPFQQYFRSARELKAGHSVLWNDGFLSDSLEASKLSAEPVLFKDTGGEFHAKKKTETPVKKGLFRKGFLNLPPIVSVPPVLPRVVKDVEVVQPSSPPCGCINYGDAKVLFRSRKGKAHMM